MAEYSEKTVAQWLDSGNLLLGAWLFVSPWTLGFTAEPAAAWNAYVTGGVIAVLAIAALYAFQDWEEWLNVLVALWLVASPWVLGFSTLTLAMSNAVAVGLLVLVFALWASTIEHDTGHKPA